MKTPKDISQTPPGMWRYQHPVTGHMFTGGFSVSRIHSMVFEYNKSNNLAPIPDLPSKITAYMCEQEPSWCISTEPPTPAEKARNFIAAAKNWAASGFKHVTQEQYEARKAICDRCPYWHGEQLFGLGACQRCGCSHLALYLSSKSCPDNPPRWNAIP